MQIYNCEQVHHRKTLWPRTKQNVFGAFFQFKNKNIYNIFKNSVKF